MPLPMKILLIFGGPSREHEVSISTARQVFETFCASPLKKLHNVELLYINKSLNASFLKNFSTFKVGMNSGSSFFTQLPTIKKFDMCFLCLHGEFGEDGTLQSILDLEKIKYTGSNAYSSKLCMDKYRSSLVVKHLKGIMLPKTTLIAHPKDYKLVKIPGVFKPNAAGSSVGVVIVKTKKDFDALPKRINEEFVYQELIEGIEITCPILQKKDGTVLELPTIEIQPKLGKFFDYKSKYADDGSNEIVPPINISKSLAKKASKAAAEIHKLLGCSVYSRSDFIVKGGKLYYLETNTLPGMTTNSLLPKSAKAYGYTFADLINFILVNSK